jgi:hypothetical protein
MLQEYNTQADAGDIADDLWAIAFAADPTRSRRIDA